MKCALNVVLRNARYFKTHNGTKWAINEGLKHSRLYWELGIFIWFTCVAIKSYPGGIVV